MQTVQDLNWCLDPYCNGLKNDPRLDTVLTEIQHLNLTVVTVNCKAID